MKRYNPIEIEQKWQQIWQENKTYQIDIADRRPKKYVAGMFPYPSGAGLHVGHVRNYSIVDVIARYQRAQGYQVLNPIGWDTFGLPAENYAIKTGIAPAKVTEQNIANFKNQLTKLGISYDWSKEINTSDPKYYRWTQWIFTEFFKRGLAYQKESYQWWDPIDKTVLANEQIINGYAERSGAKVEKRLMKQWFFKITAYADQLLEGLDQLDWPEKIKAMQRNWIGRSEGAQVKFKVDESGQEITVFTTRPDTLFGVGFIALAPENPLVLQIATADNRSAVEAYVDQSLLTSEVERMQDSKEKTGIFTGAYAIHPLSGEKVPIWVADYVLGSYGYGAVMGVPAHDQRDYQFAAKFDLAVIPVIESDNDEVHDGNGIVINSGEFNGLDNITCGQKIVEKLTELGAGQKEVTYKMRDWLISRQRYWGAPIPIAFDQQGEARAIPQDQLPVLLPEADDYKPDGSGKGVLARCQDWLNVEIDGQIMTRETDTMDGYACSSWYLLRYLNPHDIEQAWNSADANHWLPVDYYCGGDHAVAHLLYVRFWTRVFYDMGLVDFQEPIQHLVYNGYINAADGSKMSKSKGNTVDPLELINQGYGADALRVYELFIGPYDLDASWDPRGIVGTYRFLARIWTLVQEFKQAEVNKQLDLANNQALEMITHQTISRVQYNLDHLGFNTAVAALMEMVNELYKLKVDGFKGDWAGSLKILAQLVEPFAPHMANEIWQELTGKTDLSTQQFPTFDQSKLQADLVTVVVQVNGKLRAKLEVMPEITESEVINLALNQDNVMSFTDGHEIIKTIYVPKKLVSIVVK